VKKNIYASYYTGISKKAAREKDFIPMPVQQYISRDLISTYSLNYWKGHLLWNNIDIDLTDGKYRYIAGNSFGGHCTQYLHNDTLWLFKWGTNDLHCYDLLHDRLITYSLDMAISNGIGQAGK